MSKDQKKLDRAYNLIKRDKTDEALDILRPLISEEPENLDAWWLVAYAATEPREAREALLRVLEIDPNYENAPKAQSMLDRLNRDFPPEIDELAQHPELEASVFPDVFADEEMFVEEFEMFEEPELLLDEPLEDITAEPITAEDIFGMGEIDDSIEDTEPVEPTPHITADDLFAAFDVKREQKSEEEIAAGEERQARQRRRRQGSARRSLMLVGLVAVLVVAALVIMVLLSSEEDTKSEDPGALQALNADTTILADALSATTAKLDAAQVSRESRAVLAESELGRALYADICSYPSPQLPDIIDASMRIVVRQAAALQNDVEAVGVAVSLCDAAQHDTLYRIVVPIEDVIRYENNEIDWDRFHTLWQKS